MLTEELATIRREHYAVPDYDDAGNESGEFTCQVDGEPYPCPTIRVVEGYEALRDLLRRAHEAIDWCGDSALLRDVDAALAAPTPAEGG